MFVIFNDPLEIADPDSEALLAAIEMRVRFGSLASGWAKEGHRFEIKMALDAGYATLGRIGYVGHYSYGAIGRTINAAGLMVRAVEQGKIFASERLMAEAGPRFETRPLSNEALTKLRTAFERRSKQPIKVVEVVGVRDG